MFSFLYQILVIFLFILAFWFPSKISIVVMVIYALLEIIIIGPLFITKHKPKKELGLNSEEEKVFLKYNIYFRYPFGAREFSAILSTIQLSSLIFVPLFLFKGLTIPALILIVNYFISGYFSVKFNPAFFLGEQINKGRSEHLFEYRMIQSVADKIIKFQKINTKINIKDENEAF